MREFGVHSEVGKLRTVMVCRPGLAHQRLTPGNCHDLLFDDVIWVHEAQKDHYDFVLKMQERGVEVLDLHDLLAETLEDKEARAVRARPPHHRQRRRPRHAAPIVRPWLDEMPAEQLAEHLIGGIAISDLPESEAARPCWRRPSAAPTSSAADAQHAVPARSVLLDLRRRHLQPDVLAGAQARDAAAARRLQVPSALQGRRLQDLVGRLRRGLRRRLHGRRRRHADRQGRRADRHGRAHHAAGGAARSRGRCSSTRRRRA